MKLLLVLASVGTLVSGALRLTVVHTNDMHSRIDETNAHSAKCVDKTGANCYGGFARVKKAVDEIKAASAQAGRETIFLNAGDSFQGTAFYTLYKWKALVPLIDELGINVMSLGNHEFDDGPAGLAPYLRNISTPVVAANLDFSQEPIMTNTGITPSKIIKVKDVQVGVIGYLTPETKFLSQPGKVIFKDEVQSIKEEAKRLVAEGVNIIFAVGHSGYNVDMKIAANVPEVDVVVGGHTNTFLYSGTPPDIEKAEGPYPTVVEQPSGKKVPVVQAYAYTKYLGVLNLDFDDSGKVTSWSGNPKLLNANVQKDNFIQSIVDEKKKNIESKMSEQVGLTKVFLEGGDLCRMRECNLGNLIADSIVYYNALLYVGQGWTDAPIALVNGGSVRTSITLDDQGYITYGDILTAMPFENAIERVLVKGSDLMLALENSVARFSPHNLAGAFLQFSGVKVVYDLSKPPNSRVIEAKVRCANCTVPTYFPLNRLANYSVLMTSYLANGGDAFSMFKDNALSKKVIGDSDSLLLQEYIQKFSPIFPGLEGRITLLGNTGTDTSSSATHSRTSLLWTMSLVALATFHTLLAS